MNLRAPHLFLILAVLPPLVAQAVPGAESRATDRIVLKTGTVIAGSIDKQTVDTVTFTVTGKGAVQLSNTKIRALQPKDRDQRIYGIKPPRDVSPVPTTYIRYVPGKKKAGRKGTLSTGVGRWYHKESDTTLFLVGAVHIGEQSYYDRVQAILDHTDVVLFEAVKKSDQEMTAEQLASITALGKMQMAMKNALGFVHQNVAMNYNRKFWKNADVDWPTLQDHMRQNKASLPTDNPITRGLVGFVTSMMSMAKENKQAHDMLRRQMAPILAQADKILATRMKVVSSSLILFRNEKAREYVREERQRGPKGRWLSLFYGAAHLPDLAARLAKGSWQFQGVDWIEAWHFTGR